MLQLVDGSVHELSSVTTTNATADSYVPMSTTVPLGSGYTNGAEWPWRTYEPTHTYVTYWNSYPVYVCQDKTKKAIEILKSLQAEKTIEVKSVSKFIELVEKIADIL